MKQNNITMEELLEKFRVKHFDYLGLDLNIGDKVKFMTENNSTTVVGIFNQNLNSNFRIDGNVGIRKNTVGTIVGCTDGHYWVKYTNSVDRKMCLAFDKDVLIKIKE